MEVQPGQLNLLLAMLGGVLSFLSPCVLPLVPGYLSYISGFSVDSLKQGRSSWRQTGQLVWQTLLFVLGFTVIFMTLGGVLGGVGDLFFAYQRALEVTAGLLIILFGVFLAGLYRPAFLQREFRPLSDEDSTGSASFFVGAAFGFGWTPCVGPILGAILALAGSGGDALRGAVLLGAYSFGLGLPFLATALLYNYALSVFGSGKRWLGYLERAGGLILIGAGGLILAGQFGRIAETLADWFPILLEFG